MGLVLQINMKGVILMFKMDKRFLIGVVFAFLVVCLIGFVGGEEVYDIGRQYGFENPGDLSAERVGLEGDELERIVAEEGAKITYDFEGNKREITNIKEGSWFEFEGGELIKAEFTATRCDMHR